MGARGPKPGFKQARGTAKAAAAPAVPTPPAAFIEVLKPTTETAEPLPLKSAAETEYESWSVQRPIEKPPVAEEPAAPRSAAFWENPAHLAGEALRALGHRRGLSLSAMASMPEEKIRMELRYIAQRRSEEG